MPESPVRYIFLIEEKLYTEYANGKEYNEILNLVSSKEIPESVLKNGVNCFSFSFVGIILCSNRVFCVLPKYLSDHIQSSAAEIIENPFECWEWPQIVKIVKILRTYYRRKPHARLFVDNDAEFLSSHSSEHEYNEFAIAEAVIEDYIQFGIWEKHESLISVNTSDNVDWNRTVERNTPIISNGNIYYTEFYSRTLQTRSHTVTELHQYAVNKYVNSPISKLFEYGTVHYEGPCAESLDSIGDRNYLLAALENEMREIFREDTLNLFRLLIAVVQHETSPTEKPSEYIFGTTAFNIVWEDACKSAFNDMTGMLPDNIFPSPTWISRGFTAEGSNDVEDFNNKKNRLIPDIVSIINRDEMLIADAKYYLLRFAYQQRKVLDNPGVGDVTKQILYQQVLEKHTGISTNNIVNAFIFPYALRYDSFTNTTDKRIWGHIMSNMPNWDKYKIWVILAPVDEVFDCYLSNHPLEDFNLLFQLILNGNNIILL